MTTLDLYGIGIVALLFLLFYGVRAIAAYVAVTAAIVVAFAAVTHEYATDGGWPTWLVMVSGLLLCAFGLLIVRTMLIRSVSLHLLRSIDSGGGGDNFTEDIATRLHDMRGLSLVRAREGVNTLTPNGRLVAGVVAVLYKVFRTEA